jgi:hypothetical protein
MNGPVNLQADISALGDSICLKEECPACRQLEGWTWLQIAGRSLPAGPVTDDLECSVALAAIGGCLSSFDEGPVNLQADVPALGDSICRKEEYPACRQLEGEPGRRSSAVTSGRHCIFFLARSLLEVDRRSMEVARPVSSPWAGCRSS